MFFNALKNLALVITHESYESQSGSVRESGIRILPIFHNRLLQMAVKVRGGTFWEKQRIYIIISPRKGDLNIIMTTDSFWSTE